MASGAKRFLLLPAVAADTARIGFALVHGLGQLDLLALFGPCNGMAARTGRQFSMVAYPAAIVITLVRLVIEGHGVHPARRRIRRVASGMDLDQQHIRLVARHPRNIGELFNHFLLSRIMTAGTLHRAGIFVLIGELPVAGNAGLVGGQPCRNAIVFRFLLVAIKTCTLFALVVEKGLGLGVVGMMAAFTLLVVGPDMAVDAGTCPAQWAASW